MNNSVLCKHSIIALVIFFLTCSSSSLLAATAVNEKAVAHLRELATFLCDKLPITGSGNDLTLDGKASAKLDLVILKIVALGISGSAKYKKKKYINVLRKDLAKQLGDSRKCRVKVWDDMKRIIFSNTTINSNALLETKPLAYYSFNKTYNLGFDDSGNGRNGHNENGFAGDGINKSAACFNGNGKIVIDAFRKYSWGSRFSVSIWFKRTGQLQNYQGIINNGYHTNGSWEIRMGRENEGTLLGGGIITYNSLKTWDYFGLQASTDKWHHVVLTYDGRNFLYYLDTQEKIGKSKITGDIFIKNTPVTIGQAGVGIEKEYFYGCIDEAAIYNRTLSKSEVIQLFQMKSSL